MGSCSSLYYEDDEDIKALKKKQKIEAKELREFSNQLRKQQCYSELDLLGKGISSRQKKQQIKKQQNIKEKRKQRERTEKRQATSEQIKIAKEILYDV